MTTVEHRDILVVSPLIVFFYKEPAHVMKVHLCMPSVRNTRRITQMMQKNWSAMVSSRNQKHVSRS